MSAQNGEGPYTLADVQEELKGIAAWIERVRTLIVNAENPDRVLLPVPEWDPIGPFPRPSPKCWDPIGPGVRPLPKCQTGLMSLSELIENLPAWDPIGPTPRPVPKCAPAPSTWPDGPPSSTRPEVRVSDLIEVLSVLRDWSTTVAFRLEGLRDLPVVPPRDSQTP